mgnify:CR=1 FL=1
MSDFPTLYKRTATEAIQRWDISVVNGTDIVTRWGQVDGATQETVDRILKGKNIGRANETTPEQQAHLEAQARWEKQLKKGYVQDPESAMAGKVDSIIEGGVLPMLATKWEDRKDKVTYPVYVQPKLDGHRCVAILDENGKATLWTRTRKPITGLPHVVANLELLGVKSKVFDGELFSTNLTFEQMTSFIRTPTAKEGHEVIRYFIYDTVDSSKSQKERFSDLSFLMYSYGMQTVRLPAALQPVPTSTATSEDEVMQLFSSYIEDGFEGAMVRLDGKYENKRSKNLIKVKEFDSSEFRVVDVRPGRGIMADKAIFVCQNGDTTFDCKMKGSLESLEKYLSDPLLVVGKLVEVKYQGFTEYGQPRFPVGLRIRTDLD